MRIIVYNAKNPGVFTAHDAVGLDCCKEELTGGILHLATGGSVVAQCLGCEKYWQVSGVLTQEIGPLNIGPLDTGTKQILQVLGIQAKRPPDPGELKPAECRVECGGAVPPPPPQMPNARMIYNCGIAVFGNCPALKSLQRGRVRRRRREMGLWKRSRRGYRLRLLNMAVALEYPDSTAKWPEGSLERVTARGEAIGFDRELYMWIRRSMSIPEALDQYMREKIPYTPRRTARQTARSSRTNPRRRSQGA